MKKIKILYTEDDETLAFLTKDNLEQNNYEVIHCCDGKLGLDTFKADDFDICILDIMMPKMDGFELATEIRKKNTDIPIIFLSAKTLKEDRIKGLRLGADDYFMGRSLDVFISRLRKILINEKGISIENLHGIGFRFTM